MFRVISIDAQAPQSLEPLGTKPKFWFQATDGTEWLFKEARLHTGEDWAEKIASELGTLLALPCVAYELACWQGKPGVICRNATLQGSQLVHGNELMADVVPNYPTAQLRGVRSYTLEHVVHVLQEPSWHLGVPLNWQPFTPMHDALDVFVGYLMLDAWIANQDRHHENWGIVVTPVGTKHLMPSYDHAASLGHNETDETRRDRLATRDARRSMARYVERARSAFFASSAPQQFLSTLAAFRDAGQRRPAAARVWLSRLATVSCTTLQQLFAQIPVQRMTAEAAQFALCILILNQQRLLALEKEFG